MAATFDNENCWNELHKASRKWQAQCDVVSLLEQVCATAQTLLAFDYTAAFMLETSGITEKTHWPKTRKKDKTAAHARLQIAHDVIQSGQTVLIHQPTQTLLCVPLTGSREILGALYVETDQITRIVSERDQQPLQMLATLAATSLEHAILYQSAITDPLTGLFCHRHFQQELEQAIRRSMRSEQPLTLLLMDLDHFKELNDTCGHDAGNQCLIKVSSILYDTFRSTDVVARFGGDEFEVLLPDTFSKNAIKAAEKIRKKIESLRFGQNHQVTATIGIASFPQNASTAEEAFLNADAALYLAKEAGRNRFWVSTAIAKQAAATSSSMRHSVVTNTLTDSGSTLSHLSSSKTGSEIVEKVDGHPVLQRLGVSSTGETLSVEQSSLKRVVTLKRPLTPHLSPDQMFAFEQEAIITASLNHPGVVPIFNLGRDRDGRRYYTMRPLNGVPLDEILKRKARGDLEFLHIYTRERLLEILQRVAETIAYAHTSKVLHLDLNLSHIVVGEFGEVTVTDWACGSPWRQQDADENNFRLVGSVDFVAPEIVIGGASKSSAPSDVFSLGTLLFYILTGQMPFQRASTKESVEALIKGELIPPDVIQPEAIIDPMLSELCLDALSHNPNARPTAQLFAERLARLVRHEMDWTTIQFGPKGHPLTESEWSAELTPWKLDEDHWIFNPDNIPSMGGFLMWNVPVSGSFRFSCEGWVEEVGSEISLIGHRPVRGMINFRREAGYFFQLGAEANSVTKLARHEHDVLSQPSLPLEPGRKYQIELEYQDAEGLVHCAVDNQRVFSYRELFPFPGNRIGFYGYGGRTHFRPLRVDKQNWNLQIPALRAADRTYSFGHFAEALQSFNEISSNSSKRLSGLEADLKAGICLAAMNKREEALHVFRRLRGTLFEPFALAEEALLETTHTETPSLERALGLFKTLFEKFPNSQAKNKIFDLTVYSSAHGKKWEKSYTQELEIFEQLNLLAVNGFYTNLFLSQLSCMRRLLFIRCNLGQWGKALKEHLSSSSRLNPYQITRQENLSLLTALALANNRLDILAKAFDNNPPTGWKSWYTSLHRAVHLNQFEQWQENTPLDIPSENLLLLRLAQGNISEAKQCLQSLLRDARNVESYLSLIFTVVGARVQSWFEELYNSGSMSDKIGTRQKQLVLCRYALEGQDLQTAATHLNGLPPLVGAGDDERALFLLQTLLASLGFLDKSMLNELRLQQERMLAGTMLDLAKMFTGEREPCPGPLWPHALWHPEWRLWLAIWLEAKGRKKEAREIVLPAREPRYGLTHSQPAIEALLARTL